MKQEDPLFRLIQQLQPGERKFIMARLSAPGKRKATHSLTLFQEMIKLKAYDEVKLRAALDREGFPRHTAVLKSQLMDRILVLLGELEPKTSMVQALRWMREGAMLQDRRLFDLADLRFAKAQHFAEERGLRPLLPALHAMRASLVMTSSHRAPGKLEEHLNEMEDRIRQSLETLQANTSLLITAHRSILAQRERPLASSTENAAFWLQFSQRPEVRTPPPDASQEELILWNQVQAVVAFAQGRLEDAIDRFGNSLEIFERQPWLIADKPFNFLSTAQNQCNMLMALGREREMDPALERITLLQDHHDPSVASAAFWSRSHLFFSLMLRTGQTAKGIEAVPAFEKVSASHPIPFNLNEGLTTYTVWFNIALLFFEAGELHQSKKWINRILNDKTIQRGLDLYAAAKLFQLILFLESGEDELLSYSLRALGRKVHARNASHLERLVEEHLRRWMGASPDAIPSVLEEFHRALVDLETRENVPLFLQFFDLKAWVRQKISAMR